MKNNNGITLIALVVTIIVLLILAGVSIAMLTGQNGILNRASQASYQTKLADAAETLSYNCTEAISELYTTSYTSSTGSNAGLTGKDLVNTILSTVKKANGKVNDVTVTMSAESVDTWTDSSTKPTVTLTYNGHTKVGTVSDKGISWGDVSK